MKLKKEKNGSKEMDNFAWDMIQLAANMWL
jgi:hypothetical protein